VNNSITKAVFYSINREQIIARVAARLFMFFNKCDHSGVLAYAPKAVLPYGILKRAR